MSKTVLILGGTGMLGSMVVDVLRKNKDLEIIATRKPLNKTNIEKIDDVEWRYLSANSALKGSDSDLYSSWHGIDWIINCIGTIKPYIHDDNKDEVENAIKINSLFPHKIDNVSKELNVKCIQIATDCVYTGKEGHYSESDPHDATDVYGKTKSLGEVKSENFIHLRCSIIGPEAGRSSSLLEWFLGNPENATINGFTNHIWNGITTYHYAKICEGIICNDLKDLPMVQHIVPGNAIIKGNILKEFAKNFNRSDITINPTTAKTMVDRTLTTELPEVNKKIWQAAGYDETGPTIEQMVEELAEFNYSFKGDKS